MNEPVAQAKWVLETKHISGVPAVSLHAIAESEDIRYLYRTLPNDPKLAGQLLYQGKKKGIIINTLIDHKGRQNFTFAHELGHYFLKHSPSYTLDGQQGFWCSVDDIGEGQKPREVEANRFAVELLMPEDRFRLDMAGAPLDFSLISSLANMYMVSKQASSYRILDFTRDPCIVVRANGTRIEGWKASRSAKGLLHKMDMIPDGTAALRAISYKQGQESFTECDAGKWLCRSIPGQKVYECTRGNFEIGVSMTIMKW